MTNTEQRLKVSMLALPIETLIFPAIAGIGAQWVPW